jgi:hypothetical protein
MRGIDLLEIAQRHGIRRDVNLVRAERHPSARILRRKEGHQRRRKDRDDRLADRFVARHPGPTIIDHEPPPVMKWREAPILVVQPCPAPRLDPAPISVPVGSPAGRHFGIPDIAVALASGPSSIGAKFRRAGHSRCHCRGVWPMPLFLRFDPGRERVRRTCGTDFAVDRLLPGEHGRLPGAKLEIDATAGDMRAAVNDGHLRVMLGVAGNDLVSPQARERHDTSRNISLIRAIRRERPECDKHCSLWQRELRGLVVKSRYVELGRAVEIDPVAAYIERGARTRLGPERLARRDGIIASCGLPVVLVRRVIGHRAVNERETANPPRRILHCVLRACRNRDASQRQKKSGDHRQACFRQS